MWRHCAVFMVSAAHCSDTNTSITPRLFLSCFFYDSCRILILVSRHAEIEASRAHQPTPWWKGQLNMTTWRLDMRESLRTAKWCVLGTLGVAALTLIGFRLHLNFAATSFCFLLLLVLESLSGNFVASAVVSFLAVGCLDYFFTEPRFSFEVASSFDLLGLVSFLVTGLIITRLVTKVRAKTESSRLQQEKLQRLYDLAQQLLALEPSAAGSDFLEPYLGVFGIKSACLFDAVSADVYISADACGDLEGKTAGAFIRGQDGDDRENGISVRCIHAGGKTIGAIGFEGLEDAELTANSLAALAAAHLERTHAFQNASKAVATAQTESYRTAILDALAHEFKTPLSTILAAAGAIRESGSLGPDHREMAETVESEAARLGRLTSRLIRTARLEREEVKPWMELIDVASVIADTVDQYTRLSANRRISVVKECDSSEALADRELLRLAVSQLLDNACKYSAPGSTVMLRIARQRDSIAVRVLSRGNAIPSSERDKIFDRFYRGAEARRTAPGSGIGLYVARKIALALGGGLDLDSEPGQGEGTVFRLTLPVAESDRHDLVTAV
jgi:two-component system sensor histidine kinase KdpD